MIGSFAIIMVLGVLTFVFCVLVLRLSHRRESERTRTRLPESFYTYVRSRHQDVL